MDDQNRNLILATVLSIIVLVVWTVMFPPVEPVVEQNLDAADSNLTAPTAADVGGEAALVLAPDVGEVAGELFEVATEQMAGFDAYRPARVNTHQQIQLTQSKQRRLTMPLL